MTTPTLAQLADLLRAPETLKILASSDEAGAPHVEFKDWADVDQDGRLVLRELSEHSQSNRNLVGSLWFKRHAQIHLRAADGRAFALRARPHKAVIAGPLFEAHYRAVRALSPETGLSTLWLFDVEEITDETFAARLARDDAGRLPLQHLDAIAAS